MSVEAKPTPMEVSSATTKQVRWLQSISIGWLLIECGVALLAAYDSHNLALLTFGGDSFVELLSAAFALYTFYPNRSLSKQQTERWASILLYLLAAGVGIAAVAKFLTHSASESSLTGIAVTTAALIIMPILARAKRRSAWETGNAALAADATQSSLCAYLSAITLLSLALEKVTGIQWLDSVASLALLPFVITEARRTLQGEGCGCACH